MLMTGTAGASRGCQGRFSNRPGVTKPEFFSKFLEILAFARVS